MDAKGTGGSASTSPRPSPQSGEGGDGGVCGQCGGALPAQGRKRRRLCDRCRVANDVAQKRQYGERLKLNGTARAQDMDGLYALALRTQEQAGRVLGLTHDSVQRVERQAVLKVRSKLRSLMSENGTNGANGAPHCMVATNAPAMSVSGPHLTPALSPSGEGETQVTLREMEVELREWRALLAGVEQDPECFEEAQELGGMIADFAAVLGAVTNGGSG